MVESDSGQFEYKESPVRPAAAALQKVCLREQKYKTTHGMPPNDAVRNKRWDKRQLKTQGGVGCS